MTENLSTLEKMVSESDQMEAKEQEDAAFSSGFDGESVKSDFELVDHGTKDVVLDEQGSSPIKDEVNQETLSQPETSAEKTELELLQERLNKSETRLRNSEGKMGTLNSNYLALTKKFESAQSKVTNTPTEAQIKEALESEEKWSAFSSEWEETASAVEARSKMTEDRISKKFDEKFANMNSMASPDLVSSQISNAMEVVKLDIAAPGWRNKVDQTELNNWESGKDPGAIEVIKLDALSEGWREKVVSDTYKSWLGTQDQATIDKSRSEHSNDALDIIAKYDVYIQSINNSAVNASKVVRARASLEASIPPVTGTSGAPQRASEPTLEDAFASGFSN